MTTTDDRLETLRLAFLAAPEGIARAHAARAYDVAAEAARLESAGARMRIPLEHA